ncbi:MAG: phosphopantetheine-binding protein [Paracoccaceae bacterium]
MSDVNYDDVLSTLKEIFEDLADDLDLDDVEVEPGQGILSLGMESISIVYLVSELQQHYGLGNKVFDDLRQNERLLKDMTVDDIINAVLGAVARK